MVSSTSAESEPGAASETAARRYDTVPLLQPPRYVPLSPQAYTLFGDAPGAPPLNLSSSSPSWPVNFMATANPPASTTDIGAQFDALSLRSPSDNTWYMDTVLHRTWLRTQVF